MTDLRELYQEVILEHGKRPRNYRALEPSNCRAEGYNPLCGDRVTIYARTDDDTIEEVTFQGSGCAICMASASLMTQRIQGLSRDETDRLFRAFHGLVTGTAEPGEEDWLGKLIVFAGVRDYPVRVKCATLPWHTLQAALKDQQEPVTTE